MNILTSYILKESLKEAGGKEWIKEEKQHRIYFSKETFISFAKENSLKYTEGVRNEICSEIDRISTKDENKKAWLNVLTNKFESKKPSIQAFFDCYTNQEIKKS